MTKQYGVPLEPHPRRDAIAARFEGEDIGVIPRRLVGDVKARDAVGVEDILDEPLHIPFVVGAVQLQLGVDLGIALDLVDVAVEDAAIAVAGIGEVEARDERHVAASQMRGILDAGRSEEHTSELKSLMRISY